MFKYFTIVVLHYRFTELLGTILEAVKYFVAPICTYIDHWKQPEEGVSDLRRELEDLNRRKSDVE